MRVFCLFLFALLAFPSFASAQQYRRPFDQTFRVNYGYDNDGQNGGGGVGDRNCEDYACDTRCYDGHRGTDYGTPVGTPIVAAAHGIVSFVNTGCPDFGGRGDSCGGGFGNHVRVKHADGATTIYAHMKLGSIMVAAGDAVACGAQVGLSASSGNSTGPHLHFEWRTSDNGRRDPYAGACSQPETGWTDQGEPGAIPADTCDETCGCQPGDTQTQDCGFCGTQVSTCLASCQWGSFDACQDAGECRPGVKNAEPCCDCGTRERSCNRECLWEAWGECAGDRPPLDERERRITCDTGEPGVCQAGLTACQEGCFVCEPSVEAGDELCDAIDNDCDGQVDNDATTLGDVPPRYAATVIEASEIDAIAPGEEADVWVDVKNDGRYVWRVGTMAIEPAWEDDRASALRHPSWPAEDLVARNTEDIAPGETGRFVFKVSVQPDTRPRALEERFFLVSRDGAPIACPSPYVTLGVTALEPPVMEPVMEPVPDMSAPTPTPTPGTTDEGCAVARPVGSPGPMGGLVLWALLLVGGRQLQRTPRSSKKARTRSR